MQLEKLVIPANILTGMASIVWLEFNFCEERTSHG